MTTKSEARRAKRESTVAAVIQREMTDTRFDRFRTRNSRRTLVVVYAIVTVAVAVSSPLAGAIAVVAGLPVWMLVFYVMRRSVRALADIPDEHLDERQIAVRDRTYLEAYRIYAIAMLLVLFGLAIAADRRTLDYDAISGVMWGSLGLAMGLPTAVLAWTTTDT